MGERPTFAVGTPKGQVADPSSRFAAKLSGNTDRWPEASWKVDLLIDAEGATPVIAAATSRRGENLSGYMTGHAGIQVSSCMPFAVLRFIKAYPHDEGGIKIVHSA